MQHSPSIVTPMPVDATTSRRRRRGILALLLGLTTVSVGAGLFSLAYFTDSDATGTEFTSGTIIIDANPDPVVFTVDPIMPGDSLTAALTVDNTGTAELRYAMSTTASSALGDALTVEVKTLGTSCAAFDGTSVRSVTALDGAAIGLAAQGDDTGDRVLAAVTSETLCFRVALPFTAPNALQGLTSDVTFTFAAEQTANNP